MRSICVGFLMDSSKGASDAGTSLALRSINDLHGNDGRLISTPDTAAPRVSHRSGQPSHIVHTADREAGSPLHPDVLGSKPWKETGHWKPAQECQMT